MDNSFKRDVKIISRNINGKRIHRFYEFEEDFVRDFINGKFDDLDEAEEEILLVFYQDSCVYSQLQSHEEITWEELYGFFA